MSWEPDHETYLKQLIYDRKSASEAAYLFWQRFKVHKTRNAMIGRARRMGLNFQSGQRGSATRAVNRSTPEAFMRQQIRELAAKGGVNDLRPPPVWPKKRNRGNKNLGRDAAKALMNGKHEPLVPPLMKSTRHVLPGFQNLKAVPEDLPTEKDFGHYADKMADAMSSLVAPRSKPKPLMELKDKGCRWPIGDLFCNEDWDGRGPYCSFHKGRVIGRER